MPLGIREQAGVAQKRVEATEMRTPPWILLGLLPFLAQSVVQPLNAQGLSKPTSQPTSAPAAYCPIQPLVTVSLTKGAARTFDYEMTPLGIPPITITVTAPPSIHADNSIRIHDMVFVTRGLNSELIRVPLDFPGKLIVVHFWASWCPACIHEAPYWVAANRAFKDRGVAFVGIPVDKNRALSLDAVKTKSAQAGITWPQSFVDASTLSMKFYIKSLPAVFVVEGDTGRVLAQGMSVRGENLARELDTLVKQRRLSPAAPMPVVASPSKPLTAAVSVNRPDILEEIKAGAKPKTP